MLEVDGTQFKLIIVLHAGMGSGPPLRKICYPCQSDLQVEWKATKIDNCSANNLEGNCSPESTKRCMQNIKFLVRQPENIFETTKFQSFDRINLSQVKLNFTIQVT